MLRPVIAEAVITRGRSRRRFSRRARASSRSVSPMSHLLSATSVAQPRAHRELGDPQVLGGDALGRHRRRRSRRRRARRRARFGAGRSSRSRPSRLRRRRPAVSTRTISRPSNSSRVSIESRVVPATSETITRSVPRKRLTIEDLPTFGRPMIARRIASSSGSRLRVEPAAISATRSSRSPVPSPCVAETGMRLAEAERVELGGERLVRTAVDLVGDDDHGLLGAAQQLGRPRRRPGPSPARASTRAGSRRRRRSPRVPGAGRRARASPRRRGRRRRCRSGRSGPRSTRPRSPCGRA